MARKRVNSLFDQQSIEKELQFMTSNLNELSQQIKAFPTIKTKVDGASNLKELSKLQTAYKESLKSVETLVKQRMASEAKLITLQTDYARETKKNQIEITKKNAALKAESEFNLANAGSIDKARAAVKKLTQERNQLNLYTDAGRKRQDELNKSIDKYNEFIKKNVSLLEKQKINVGNYQGSAKIIAEAFERAQQKVAMMSKSFGDGSPEMQAARREMEALGRITSNPGFLNVSAKIGDASAEVKFFTKSLIDLERQGQKDTTVYKQLQAQLAELTDQIGDTKAEIKALSSDTRQFDLFAGSVNFAADAFQTLAGSAQLFGASEEDAAKATATLVAVTSVANGVKGIANELTTRGTAANKAYAFVQNLVSVALDKSAASAVRLNAAMGLIAIAATVIGALVVAFAAMGNKAEETADKIDTLSEIMKEGRGEYVKAVGDVNKLRIEVDLAKRGFIDKKGVVELYNDTLGKTIGTVKTLDEVEQSLAKNAEAYIKFTLLKAAANIALGKAAEEAFNAELLSQARKQSDDNLKKEMNKAEEYRDRTKVMFKGVGDLLNSALIDVAKGKQKTFTEIAQSLFKQAADISKAFNFSFDPQDNKSDKKDKNEKKKKEEEEAAKQEFELLKIRLQRQIDFDKKILDSDNATYIEKTIALKRYQEDTLKLINAQQAEEFRLAKGNGVEQQIARENAYNAQIQLAEDTYNYIAAIAKKGTASEQYFLDKNSELANKIAEKYSKKFITDPTGEDSGKDIKKTEDYLRRKKELYIQFADEVKGLFFDLFTNNLEQQKNAIQDQIDLLDAKTAKEIEAADTSITNEQEKAAAIASINARAATEKKRLELEQRRIDQEKARFEKSKTVAQIIQSTALAIVETLAAYPGAAGIALSVVIGAIGAVQLARAIAAPIPKYEKGTKNAKRGLALVSEKGQELMVDRSGRMQLTPKDPSFIDLKGGETIIPADLTRELLIGANQNTVTKLLAGQAIDRSNDSGLLQESNHLLRKIANKPPHHTTIYIKHDGDWNTYINKQVKQ